MPLSWNEIRNRTYVFAKRWEDETSENAEAKPFWIEFLNVFGIDRKRVASFEEPVKKLGNKQGFIDLFWKGMLLIEHKSRGMDLDKAYSQALDYFPGIKDRDLRPLSHDGLTALDDYVRVLHRDAKVWCHGKSQVDILCVVGLADV